MNILLTNDDGMDAPGLEALVEVLRPEFEIAVVAPDRERSAISHAVTFRRYLHPVRQEAPYPAFSVNGTPADCVKLSILALLDGRPDFVISGINRGINVGHDVLYSGTVAGALEGAMQGIPAMSVSLDSFESPDFGPSARFVLSLLKGLRRSPPLCGIALNVNLPYLDPESYRGIRWTRQRGCLFRDAIKVRSGPDGRTEYLLDGEIRPNEALEPGSDALAVKEGYVSITPLGFDLTAGEDLSEFRDALPPLEHLTGGE